MEHNKLRQEHSSREKIPELFLTFMKIGAFTFGGGYAMIPLIQREIADRRGWVSDEDILDIIAIAESTPGPIAVNSATFVGWHVAGFWGAFFATLGVVIPSFLIILLVAGILPAFESNRIVKAAFFGVRAGVLALILNACVSMYKASPKEALSYGIMAAAFVLVAFLRINAIYVIILSAAAGLAGAYLGGRKR